MGSRFFIGETMILALDERRGDTPAEALHDRLFGVPDWDASTQQQLEALVTGDPAPESL